MVLELYVDYMSQPSRAVLLFCRINNIPHQVRLTQLMKRDQLKPEYSMVNPMRKVPAIYDTEKDFKLFESHAILRYLAAAKTDGQWYPQNLETRAIVDQFLDWHHTNLRVGAAGYIFGQY